MSTRTLGRAAVACLATVTSSAATSSTTCTAAFATGVGTLGPLTPQLGRDLRAVLTGTWTGTVTVGTTTTSDCSTFNALTIGGSAWATWTTNSNEVFDTPTLSGVNYCVHATITSGSLIGGIRQ